MSFYTDVIMKDPRFNSGACVRDMQMLEPVTREAVKAILADALAMGIALRITETYRSSVRQQQMFAQGESKLKTVGVHHYGLACDFCKIVSGGQASWAGDWAFLRDLAEKHGMISGIDWGRPLTRHSFIDPDHVQRVALDDQAKLFSGAWYPDDVYKPLVEVALA